MTSLLVFVAGGLIAFGGEFLIKWLRERARMADLWAHTLVGLPLAAGIALPLYLLGSKEAMTLSLLSLLGAALVAGMLADHLRLSRWLQFFMGFALAWWAVHEGFVITEVKPPFFTHFIDLGNWAKPVTLVWILAVVFAVFLCRRLPGLTTGLISIVALAFLLVMRLVFASSVGLAAPLASALAGASLGAFPHGVLTRLSRNKTGGAAPFLHQGAAGHWVMGFALALLTVIGFLKNTAFLVLAAPLLILGVPLFEATYAFIYGGPDRRISFSLAKRRELLHEALLRGGLSPRRCIAVFLGLTLYFSAVAVLLAALVRISFLVKFAILIVAGVAGFVLFFVAAKILSRRQAGPGAQAERLDFLDVPVAALDMGGALRRIEAFIEARTPHMVVTSDSAAVVRAHRDKELATILKEADLVTPDGTGVVWMAKVLGLPIEQRVPGIDLLEQICGRAAQKGWSVYFLGGEPGVAERAAQRLAARYAGLRVAGCMHGYFPPEEEPGVVAQIAAKRPDVLFVGFGIPLQEKWIARHLQQLGTPVAIGVGGSFDVLSGRLQRAPKWMQTAGLEWLYRVLQEPKRTWRLASLPRLFLMTLKRAYNNRRQRRR